MKFRIFFSVMFIFVFSGIHAQEIVSVTFKGSRTKAQITSMFSLPLIKYGARYYHVKYTSVDASGIKDTLSGLLAIPDDLKYEYPRLVYQHGTSDCKTCVPSRYGTSGGDEGQLGLLFAGMGFVSVLPDYVGMGDGRGFQTYVHAASIICASADMLAACQNWTSQNGIYTNEQLFVTGYSQGGYASMALHKHLESTSSQPVLTAAAHLSGPYSLSGVMRDLILSETEYFYPAYVPNTILGFNEAYGKIYADFGDIFKPEYVSDIRKYYEGSISLSTLNNRLIQALKTNTGSSVGGRLIREEVKAEIISNPEHIINKILKENDLHNWAPQLPTRIFYCKADDQVPFMNSVVARDTMLAKGASNLIVTDINSNANHSTCFTPAITQTLLFFLSFQKITSSVDHISTNENQMVIYPNPAYANFNIYGLEGGETITLIDAMGRQIQKMVHSTAETAIVDVQNVKAGMYTVIIQSEKGVLRTFKLTLIK